MACHCVKNKLCIKNKNILKKKAGSRKHSMWCIVQTAASVAISELIMYVKVIQCSREFEYV